MKRKTVERNRLFVVEPLEREILGAVSRAGDKGLTELAADSLFKRRCSIVRRKQTFNKLKGLGLIVETRSPGGGSVFKKATERKPTAPQAKARGDVRTYRCERWPWLSIRNEVKFSDGFFQTADPELQSLIEGLQDYGLFIIRLDGDEAQAAVKAAKARSVGAAVAIH